MTDPVVLYRLAWQAFDDPETALVFADAFGGHGSVYFDDQKRLECFFAIVDPGETGPQRARAPLAVYAKYEAARRDMGQRCVRRRRGGRVWDDARAHLWYVLGHSRWGLKYHLNGVEAGPDPHARRAVWSRKPRYKNEHWRVDWVMLNDHGRLRRSLEQEPFWRFQNESVNWLVQWIGMHLEPEPLTFPIADLPVVEAARWNLGGPLPDAEIERTFGSAIDLFGTGNGDPPRGITEVATEFELPGPVQVEPWRDLAAGTEDPRDHPERRQ